MFTLCLSGGGFRATLFHLGVLRRMMELNMFKEIERMTSVSGGSITAAMVLVQLTRGGEFKSLKDFDRRVTVPLIDFIQRSPKKRIYNFVPVHRNPRRFSGVLEKLFGGFSFVNLTPEIKWECLSTSLESKTPWEHSQTRIGNRYHGYREPNWDDKISVAVAASACFIPVFQPMGIEHGAEGKIYLVDGGVYDNLGIDRMLKSGAYTSSELIISDASSTIESWEREKPSSIMLYKRGMDIAMAMSTQLRHREIKDKILDRGKGVMIEVCKPLEFYIDNIQLNRISRSKGLGLPKYQKVDKRIQKELGEIRTDLNAFHDVEIQLLIWSGMSKVDAVIKGWKGYSIEGDMWKDTPTLKLDHYQKDEVLRILKKGDNMTILESHKKLHKGKPYKYKIMD